MKFPLRKINIVKKIDIDSSKFHCFGSRETCVIRDFYLRYLLSRGTTAYISIANGDIYDFYFEEASTMEVFRKMNDDMKNNWNKHIGEYKPKSDAFIKAGKKLGEVAKSVMNHVNTEQNDKKVILQSYKEFVDQAFIYSEYVWTAWAVIYITEKEVMEKLSEKLNIIISLDQPITFLNMQRDLFTLSDEELVDKYCWLNAYSVSDKLYDVNDFENMRKEVKKEEILEQFSKFDEVKKNFEELLNSIEDEDLKKAVIVMHNYAFLKTDRMDVWKKGFFESRAFYEYLTTLVENMTLRDAANMFSEEVIDLLEKDIKPGVNKLKLRSNNETMYYYHDDVAEILYGKENTEAMLKKLENIDENIKEFAGIVACKGNTKKNDAKSEVDTKSIVTGKAKIINSSKDISKVEKGDIFVSRFTFPSYTPAMVKCSAVVTDEGGITGHAAIVSREHNIPCIIAAKIATKVLKDGDMIEVNAEKGIVKKQ